MLGSEAETYRPQLVLADVWISQGQLDLATIWLDLASKSIDDWPRTFGHPISEMTRLKLEIANSLWEDAESRLLHLCEMGRLREHNGLLVQIYSYLAYVVAQQGRDVDAIEYAKRAQDAGKHGEFLHSFLINGLDIREFIFTTPSVTLRNASNARQTVDVLSLRELDVIRLLGQGITNQEIADTLYISRNTVKIHLQNIYRKLGAANRREAVEVCRWMGLLGK